MEPTERRLLAAMPLHAITAVHGETGLRERLAVETATFPSDADVVCSALLHDAVEDHAGDLSPGDGPAKALAVIAGQFGRRVAELVEAVTNPEQPLERLIPAAIPDAVEDSNAAEHVAV